MASYWNTVLTNAKLIDANDEYALGTNAKKLLPMPKQNRQFEDEESYVVRLTDDLIVLQDAVDKALKAKLNPLNDVHALGLADELIQRSQKYPNKKDMDLAGKDRDQLVTLIASALRETSPPEESQKTRELTINAWEQGHRRVQAHFDHLYPWLLKHYGNDHSVALSDDGRVLEHDANERALMERLKKEGPSEHPGIIARLRQEREPALEMDKEDFGSGGGGMAATVGRPSFEKAFSRVKKYLKASQEGGSITIPPEKTEELYQALHMKMAGDDEGWRQMIESVSDFGSASGGMVNGMLSRAAKEMPQGVTKFIEEQIAASAIQINGERRTEFFTGLTAASTMERGKAIER